MPMKSCLYIILLPFVLIFIARAGPIIDDWLFFKFWLSYKNNNVLKVDFSQYEKIYNISDPGLDISIYADVYKATDIQLRNIVNNENILGNSDEQLYLKLVTLASIRYEFPAIASLPSSDQLKDLNYIKENVIFIPDSKYMKSVCYDLGNDKIDLAFSGFIIFPKTNVIMYLYLEWYHRAPL